jgi:hypothetical protein
MYDFDLVCGLVIDNSRISFGPEVEEQMYITMDES